MLFGVEYLNGLGSMRNTVYSADSIEDAIDKFYGEEYNIANGFDIVSVNVLNTKKCVLLYQSGRDIVHVKELDYRTIINGEDIAIIVDNVPYFRKAIKFEQSYLHFSGNTIEVMVCIHDGLPNWLY